ncbi:MAG: hypothetical protein ACRENP_11955 [Longimicrobiales bacterium]
MKPIALLFASLVLLSGCMSEPASPQKTPGSESGPPAFALSKEAQENDLIKLRRITARFRHFQTAVAAGWSEQITPCLTDELGGMGYHYGKPQFIDAIVQLEKPEVLLYEPDSEGVLRLVGVEYIVPVSAWTKSRPPRLFGRNFHVVPAFQVWALHVWVWKDNPSGTFADWNPNVSCKYASDTSPLAHH